MERLKHMFAIEENPHRPVPKQAYGWRLYICVLCAMMGAAINGYQTSFIGGAVELPGFVKDFGKEHASLIISLYVAGSLVGGVISYFLTERWGRKPMFTFAAAATVMGTILQISSTRMVGLLSAGRFISGLGGGFAAVVVPVYISEIAPPNIRGLLVSMAEVSEMVFALLGFWICYGMEQHIEPTSMQWQIPFGLQLASVALLLCMLQLLTESPRWSVKRDKENQAVKGLAWIRNLPPDHPYVALEHKEMRAQIADEYSRGGHGVKAMVRELLAKDMWQRLALAAAAKFFHTSTGAAIMDSYSIKIFSNIGYSGDHEVFLLTGIYGAIQAVFTIGFACFVDKFGRRKMLIFGIAPIVIGHFYLGAYSHITGSFDHEIKKGAGSGLALFALYSIGAGHASSWAAYPEIFAAEVFPTRLRAFAVMLVNIIEGILHFVVAYTSQAMIDRLKSNTFFMLGSISVVGFFAVVVLYPETKGFPLEKMDYIFNGSVWALKAREEAEKLLADDTAAEKAREGSDSDIETGGEAEREKNGAVLEVAASSAGGTDVDLER